MGHVVIGLLLLRLKTVTKYELHHVARSPAPLCVTFGPEIRPPGPDSAGV